LPTQTAPPRGGQNQKVVTRRAFIVGTRRVDSATYDQTKVMTAGTQDLPSYEVDPSGFLAGFYILVEATSTASAATVFAEDAPFTVLDTITLNDTNNKPLIGPWTGYDLYIACKYGGYSFSDDARGNTAILQTATSGSFSFALRLPVELVHRDAMGSLTNKSSSATYKLNIRLAGTTAGPLFNDPKNAAPSVRVRVQQFGWMDPNDVDIRGNPVAQNPPGVTTTQFWEKQTYTLAFGAVNQRLSGIDAFLRNLIFVVRDSTASSATAAASATGGTSPRNDGEQNFPDPFTLQYETVTPIQRLKSIWRHMIWEDYAYNAPSGTAAQEAAGNRDRGVFPETFVRDFGLKPGAEQRLGYLPASAASTFKIIGTQGSTGTGPGLWTVLVNKVVPAGGDPMALTGRQS
jgi:hypothetical protein